MTNKELSRKIFDEIYTEGRLDRIEPTHDEHCKLREPSWETMLEGPEAVRRYVKSLRDAFPDLRMTVERQVAEGDLVASQIVCQGTHRGPYMGIEPTGNPVTVRATVVHRFRSERVVEADVTYDVLSLLFQLEMAPAKAIQKELSAALGGRARVEM